MSLDGYLDDSGPKRLVLSNEADLDRVDTVRASCDAILVGANTIRRDNPRLLIRSGARQDARRGEGLPAQPVKVTMTRSGDLDPDAYFFTTGTSAKLVYCPASTAAALASRLGDAGTVIETGDRSELRWVLSDLAERGVNRLMVEGGGAVLTQFLLAGLADELQLVIAPFLVGDPEAPRFVEPGTFPHNADRPMKLADVHQLDDCVLLRYLT